MPSVEFLRAFINFHFSAVVMVLYLHEKNQKNVMKRKEKEKGSFMSIVPLLKKTLNFSQVLGCQISSNHYLNKSCQISEKNYEKVTEKKLLLTDRQTWFIRVSLSKRPNYKSQ